MAPKSDKAKGKAVKSAEALRLEALRKETATFPPQLDALVLRDKYRLFWSTKTRAHPRTRVLPADAQRQYPTGYPFFVVFFYCGLCPPYSEFFCDIMYTYGLHILDFTPNAVLTMAVFAHLCENFVGVRPNVALFFIHRQEPPGLGHTRCRALLGQALTVHGHAWPGSRCSLTPHPSRLPQVARAYRGVVGARRARCA